ncbi:nuclease-related domain-containing protein [Saccharothrix longispora]|uniref:nuclease-related domain-containing protein n=1 Tax=Saccharothrix longispora TaxID=33920 RepID=UPI0028FD7C8C|nr:NERD domain-containing protein [Saccharothrix longispora]MDU0287681.1 NERD domain-containing protein [Saccharothrix longispora]
MLVRVQNEAALSGAERRLVEWLGSWVGSYALPGAAMVNCNVPGSNGATRQVDAVVWSPHGCVVVEVKGFTRRQDGVLRIPLNGGWTVDGQPAALHTSGEANPVEQLRTNLYAVKNGLRSAGVDPGFVAGVVLVLPIRGARVELDHSMLPPGVDVVLASGQKPLRGYFHRLVRHHPVWAADDVASAFTALDLSDFTPERDELLAHGFSDQISREPRPRPATARPAPRVSTRTTGPSPTPRRTGTGAPAPNRAPRTTAPPRVSPLPRAQRHPVGSTRRRSADGGHTGGRRRPPSHHPDSPAPAARPRPGALRAVVITALILVALVVMLWLVFTIRATFHPTT